MKFWLYLVSRVSFNLHAIHLLIVCLYTKSGDTARTEENQENSSRKKMASKKSFEWDLSKRFLVIQGIVEKLHSGEKRTFFIRIKGNTNLL